MVLFLNVICEAVTAEDDLPPQIFRLIEFKEKYEMFCFLGGYKERPLKGEKELLYTTSISLHSMTPALKCSVVSALSLRGSSSNKDSSTNSLMKTPFFLRQSALQNHGVQR
jgi:hypothetical protein